MVTDRVCYEVYNEELGYTEGMYESLNEAIEVCSNKCRKHGIYQLDMDERIPLHTFGLISGDHRVIAEIKYDKLFGNRCDTYTNVFTETFCDKNTIKKIQSRKVFLYWLDAMKLYSHVVSVKIVRID